MTMDRNNGLLRKPQRGGASAIEEVGNQSHTLFLRLLIYTSSSNIARAVGPLVGEVKLQDDSQLIPELAANPLAIALLL